MRLVCFHVHNSYILTNVTSYRTKSNAKSEVTWYVIYQPCQPHDM